MTGGNVQSNKMGGKLFWLLLLLMGGKFVIKKTFAIIWCLCYLYVGKQIKWGK
jgi:hypothetical protein